DGGERLSIDGQRSVWVSHDDRHVREKEVGAAPTERGDLVSDLIGALHVVVADGPEMARSGCSLAFAHCGLRVASRFGSRRCPLRSMSSWQQRAPGRPIASQ